MNDGQGAPSSDDPKRSAAADGSKSGKGRARFTSFPHGGRSEVRNLQSVVASAGRPSGLTAYGNWDEFPYNPNNWTMKNLVTGTAFNKAGQMTSLTAYGGSETRSYNDLQQLTGIQAALTAAPNTVRFDLSYAYPAAGGNNGRISAEINNPTNTQVSYTYDQVNRLATAASATGGTTNWGLSFSYDVYGNRTAQTVTAGSAPAFSASFGSNNRRKRL